MRVVLHTTAAAGHRTGIGHYTAELLPALNRVRGVQVYPYPNPALARFRERLGGGKPPEGWDGGSKVVPPSGGPVRDLRFSPRHWVRAPLRFGWRMVMAGYARAAFDPRYVDLYHEPNFFPLRTRLPTVVTVHDLSAVLHPEWHPPGRVALFERDFLPRVKDFAHILTVSDAAKDEIARTFSLSRVTRAYNGVREHLRPLPREAVDPVLKRLGLPPTYLLHVGTIEPRKNLLMLLRAYTALPVELRARCPLVLVGPWGWRFEEVASYYESEARHRNVMHLGYVADSDLPAVYNGARALVFPTLYEGFGMPAAEMLACGGAVIGSDTPALTEVLGGCGTTVDPLDRDGWRAAMADVISNPDRAVELCRGGVERAREFTWANCARDTVKAYWAVLDKTPAPGAGP